MKIVLIGGHLSPALSVLEALPPRAQVLFIGRKYGFEGDKALSLEYQTISKLGIPFEEIKTGRLQRKFTPQTIPSLLKLPFGFFSSFSIIKKFNPDIVVGFGGYVSIPVVFSAFLLRIPIVIHEQTLGAGFANRILSKFAAKICISWQTSSKYFPKEKVVLTGNPIRKFPIHNTDYLIHNTAPLIYVTGGSSGSHFINVLIEGCIEKLLEKYTVIHQTGDSQEFHDYDRLEKLKNNLPIKLREHYILKKFVDPQEVGNVLNRATFVVSRSGMNTITELIYFEKPSLLIPLPFSQNNEQLRNAKFLEKLGIAIVLQQAEIDSRKLFLEINSMLDNINNYKIDKAQLKNLAIKNAAQNILQVINYVYKSKTNKIS